MKIIDLQDKYINPIKMTFQNNDIIINQYISYETKIFIANSIKMVYFSPTDDIEYSNVELKDAIFKVFVLKFYTDIDMTDVDYLLSANIAIQTGLYDKIIKNIPESEIETLKIMVEDSINEEKYRLLQENSIENQLNRFLTKALQKIPDDKGIAKLVKTVKKEINGFKPEKMKVLNDIMKSLGEKEIPNKETLEKGINIAEDILLSKDS